MKRVRYGKYVPDLAGEMDLESLLEALSDFFMDSGYQDPWSVYNDFDGDYTMENLREALRRALEEANLSKEMRQQLDQLEAEGLLDEFLDKLIARMQEEGLISTEDAPQGQPNSDSSQGHADGEAPGQVRFEVT